MMVEIPILIERQLNTDDHSSLYSVRLLFFDTPEHQHRDLSKAISRLEQDLRKQLRSLARDGDHQLLSNYTFSPHVSLHWLDLRLDLKRGMQRCQSAICTFPYDHRVIAFSPSLGDVWFEGETRECD